VQDDDHVVGSACDRIRCRLIGNVEEFQRIAGHLDFKAAVGGRNGSYLKFRHAKLDVFDSVAFFIDDPPFDGDAILCK
jgi:hypothetical protein